MSDSENGRLRFGERMGLNLGPVPIRILLAVTFIWAGAGKFFAQQSFTGEDALALYNMKLIAGPAGATPDPAPEDPAVEGTDPAETPTPGEGGQIGLANTPQIHLVAQGETVTLYTAEDFTEPIEKKRLFGVAVMLYKGANPGIDETTSKPKMSLVPEWAAGGKTPVVLAYIVSITELVAGVLVLFGLLTRLSALGLVGTMAGAIWLTVCGPAMQSGNAFLWILPNHGAFSYGWTDALWQLALLGAAGSLFFTGAGSISLHNLLFASRAEDDEDDFED